MSQLSKVKYGINNLYLFIIKIKYIKYFKIKYYLPENL
jgi:hypothetical protein